MNSIPLSEEQQKGSLNNLFPHSIALLFSNRHDGNMSFCHGEMASVLANRKIFCKRKALMHLALYAPNSHMAIRWQSLQRPMQEKAPLMPKAPFLEWTR